MPVHVFISRWRWNIDLFCYYFNQIRSQVENTSTKSFDLLNIDENKNKSVYTIY